MKKYFSILCLMFLSIFPIFLVSSFTEASSKPKFTPINVIDHQGKQRVLGVETLKSISTKLPDETRVFSDQVMIPMVKILAKAQVNQGKTIQFEDNEGQRVRFRLEDIQNNNPPLAIVNTHHGKWKLIKKTDMKKKRAGNFYLRSLKTITVLDHSPQGKNTAHKGCKNSRVYVNLSDAMKEPKKVCILNLSGQNQKVIPQDTFQLKNLRELYLGRNQIEEIPPEVRYLKKLSKLYMGRNDLKTLPPEIGSLKNLKILKVGRNQITTLPKEIGKLKNLTKLELDNNQVRRLPSEVGQMKSLKELELANNPINQLPSTLAQLKKLEKVELNEKAFNPEQRKEVEKMLPGVEIEWE